MSGKFALIIGNTEYIDPGLAELTAPGKDAEDFARILKDKDLCAFDEVNILLNQPEYIVRGAIDEFFDQKKPDDLIILYFSGHGIRDELGALYLAVKNTIRGRLRSTAIKSDFIREAMNQSRSKRQVLVLDCCNSGAFTHGMKASTGSIMGMAKAFEGTGYGHIVLTASDEIQFAWEGDKVIGETDNSLFTHFLIEGLEGGADQDGDGKITVDDLYDYVYEQVVIRTPKQTPGKWSYKQQGEIVLRQNILLESAKSILISNGHIPLATREGSSLDKQLAGEHKYAAQIALKSNTNRKGVSSFYMIAVGSLVAALFGTQLFEIEKYTQTVKIMFSGLFVLLTLLGTSTIMGLARLRGAWYESMLAMNHIKDFAVSQNHEIAKAFRWTTATLPPKYKINSVSYYEAFDIALISGIMLGIAVSFLQQAFFSIGFLHWTMSILVGSMTTYLQLLIYKQTLK